MKNLLFILILFYSFNSFAQFNTMLNDTLKPFGIGAYDFACIIQDDSFYYALGGVNNNEPLWNNMIIKFDKNFNIVNKKKYIDTNWHYANYPYNTIVSNNKQILTCPQIYKNQITYGKIIALNKFTLDTIWSTIINHPDTLIALQQNSRQFSDLTAIKETPDNGYILTGNYNKDCITGNIRSFLLKIDSLGNVEWRKTYSSYYTFFDIEIAADSGYIIPSGYNGTNAMQLVKFNKNGAFEWSKRVMQNPLAGYPLALSIYNTNYAFVCSYYIYDETNSYTGVNISKINLNSKTVLWEKNYILYQSIECLGLHQAIGVETLSDGSIIVNGTLEKYGVDKSGFILKLNSDGDSLWTKTYVYNTNNTAIHQLNDLLICDDGGFLGVGFYKPPNGLVAWMFKTDANGVVGWETPKPKIKGIKFKVWPNPASEFVNIDFKERLKLDIDIIIYNSLGIKVKTVNVKAGQTNFKIEVDDLETGVYFYEIIGEKQILGSGKFVKL